MTPITHDRLLSAGWQTNYVGFPAVWRKGNLTYRHNEVYNRKTGTLQLAWNMEDIEAAERSLQ